MCDDARDADLFWALRGGGGGNFGVVTSLTLRTHPSTNLAIGFVSWPWSRAAIVASVWQEWMSRAPDALWSTLHLQTGGSGPEVTMHAVLTGTAADLAARFDTWSRWRVRKATASKGSAPIATSCWWRRDAWDGRSSQCHLAGTTPDGVLGRETYVAKSAIARQPLSGDAIAVLVKVPRLTQRTQRRGGGAVLLDSLGGASRTSRPMRPRSRTGMRSRVAQLLGSWEPRLPERSADAAIWSATIVRHSASARRTGATCNCGTRL